MVWIMNILLGVGIITCGIILTFQVYRQCYRNINIVDININTRNNYNHNINYNNIDFKLAYMYCSFTFIVCHVWGVIQGFWVLYNDNAETVPLLLIVCHHWGTAMNGFERSRHECTVIVCCPR